MKLMRFLTAGKSWVGGKGTSVSYRMSDPRAMPKFGPAKNPFRSTTQTRQKVLGASSSATVSAEQQNAVGARTAPVRRSQESQTTSALLPDRCQHSGAVRAGTVRAPAKQDVPWWAKLVSLVPRPRSGAAKTGGARLLGKGAVQGELSLEKIRVMRNDLSDTDLEVVPARATTRVSTDAAAEFPADSERKGNQGRASVEEKISVPVGGS